MTEAGRTMCNTSADAIYKAILPDLAKGVKVDPTDRYDSIINTIVAVSNTIRRKGRLANERTESSQR